MNQLDDLAQLSDIIAAATAEAAAFLGELGERPAGTPATAPTPSNLPETGLGALGALDQFNTRFRSGLSGGAGGRYFGFVTGGVTPAALLGDWLTSVYDQNAFGSSESNSAFLEVEAIQFLCDLFQLGDQFTGSFVTGATMSNFVSLAIARQWIGQQHGVDVAADGIQALPPFKIYSGTPHASIFKALAMLGIGRNQLVQLPCLADREAVDVAALSAALAQHPDEPAIVVANAGTVNTVDFDDIAAIVALRETFPFWLHVDGAFGGFAGCLPAGRHLTTGIEQADSITIDAHKWLNVPYDSAMQFTRHHGLQTAVFQNAAVYLDTQPSPTSFIHMTPENSRRFRALPAWFSLMAYGRDGHREMVERCCKLAAHFGALVESSPLFRLVAPVQLNGVCFVPTIDDEQLTLALVQRFLAELTRDGRVFLTPTMLRGTPAIRVSISNWRTTADDIETAWQAIIETWARVTPASN